MATAAVALHLAGLVAYTAQAGLLPLSGLAPVLSSLAFMIGLLCAGLVWLTGEVSILLLGLPIVVLPLAVALLAGFEVPAASAVDTSGWFLLHTTLSLLGLALLGVACTAAVLYLLQHRQLKDRQFGVIFQFVPPLEQLDRLNHLALVVGFVTLTVGIVLAILSTLGASEVLMQNPAHRGWGLLAWVLFGLLAGLRLTGRLHGRRGAYATIGAFAVVALSYVLLQALSGAKGTRFL